METLLRATLIDWLRSDPALANTLNAITEEAPARAHRPWLALSASASTDWSTKDRNGREIRIALELHCRGDDPATAADLVSAIEARVESMPPDQPAFAIVTGQFLRSRAEQRTGNVRAILIEYRFRLLAA